MTAAAVSAGVAFAATTGPAGDGPGGQGGGHSGSPLAAAASRAALSALASQEDAAGRSQQGRTASSPAPVSATTGQPGGGRQHPDASRSAAPAAGSGAPAAGSAAAAAEPARPYEFYDSTDPQTVPAGAEIAVYATGGSPTPASAVAGRRQVLWIDTLATDPQAQVLDIEPGCAQPSQAPQWVTSHLNEVPGSVAILYTMLSEWPAVQSAVASLPAQERSRIRWWIADPTGSPHVVPGSNATQWFWGATYDISTALPDF